MANYQCTTRTNYFHVKNEDAFVEFMSRAYGSEDSIDLWTDKDNDGKKVFGFGCYGGIAGLKGDDYDAEGYDEDDYNFDAFVDGLQAHVAENDAIIIKEAGNEKMRYVVGSVLVVTSESTQYKEIGGIGVEAAKMMLGNHNWTTRMDY